MMPTAPPPSPSSMLQLVARWYYRSNNHWTSITTVQPCFSYTLHVHHIISRCNITKLYLNKVSCFVVSTWFNTSLQCNTGGFISLWKQTRPMHSSLDYYYPMFLKLIFDIVADPLFSPWESYSFDTIGYSPIIHSHASLLTGINK